MKKNELLNSTAFLTCTLFISNYCTAQKINYTSVPAAVKASFKKEFPAIAEAKWELENRNYEANFKSDGHSMSAVLDAKGTLLETETAIAVSALPPAVTTYLLQHYKSAVIREAAIIKKAGGEVLYEAGVNHKDILFKSNGTFIREEKD
jgi:hypothetical protein